MKTLDIDSLSSSIGIAAEKLLICTQLGMAERDWFVPEENVGTTNEVDVIAAIHLACGAWLLECGITFQNAKQLLTVIAGVKRRERNSLNLPLISEAIHGSSSAVVQIADGRFVRWKIGLNDTGWISFASSVVCHEPTAVIALDVARLRDSIGLAIRSP